MNSITKNTPTMQFHPSIYSQHPVIKQKKAANTNISGAISGVINEVNTIQRQRDKAKTPTRTGSGSISIDTTCYYTPQFVLLYINIKSMPAFFNLNKRGATYPFFTTLFGSTALIALLVLLYF